MQVTMRLEIHYSIYSHTVGHPRLSQVRSAVPLYDYHSLGLGPITKISSRTFDTLHPFRVVLFRMRPETQRDLENKDLAQTT